MFPNVTGRLSYSSANDTKGAGYENGALYYAFPAQNVKTLTTSEGVNIPADPAVDASRANSSYSNAVSKPRVDSLQALALIRAY